MAKSSLQKIDYLWSSSNTINFIERYSETIMHSLDTTFFQSLHLATSHQIEIPLLSGEVCR